jgi:hypothetical protein
MVLLASCDQLSGLFAENSATPPVPSALFPLHSALEEGHSKSDLSVVAVLAVVSQTRIGAAGAEAKNADPEALRLERLVRQELNNGFIRNHKLEVVQPDSDAISQAQAEVLSVNNAALSSELAQSLGQKLKVDYVVCAVIEADGRIVNVASQRTSDGKLVFQDSVRDWSIFEQPAEPD